MPVNRAREKSSKMLNEQTVETLCAACFNTNQPFKFVLLGSSHLNASVSAAGLIFMAHLESLSGIFCVHSVISPMSPPCLGSNFLDNE